MSDSVEKTAAKEPNLIKSSQLPVACPPKDSAMAYEHPRVYLKFNSEGQSKCPYCGARYMIKD